ncbi:MAG: AMP-binding protein, partial [Oscillospiraceae bacterium]|nr:AMP-binding protein [Oscillospiraceae bacterium]
LMGILVSELERRTVNGSHFDIPLRLALMSGDWIPVGLPKAVGRIFSGIHTVSLGGATEASVWSIAYDIDTDREYSVHIPYGYPLRNQQMYVLSETLEPLPENVEGDIFIGGDGVADGYQNDRIQTDKAFIVHERYGRIYRTGDYGYISNEGCMEFCGRKDFQVKINGLRIELGDIDSTVKKIAGIKDSISTVQTNESGGDFLCTYVQPDWKDNRREIADGFSPEQMKEHEHTIMSEFNIEKYSVLISTLERFCVDCMAESLVQLGIDKLNGERISVSDILERLKIADNRHVNFRQWFNTLRENDIIGYKDGIFRFYAEKIESPDVPYRQLNEYGIPDYMEQIMNYIIQSRKKLSEIMLGNVDPISEMFFKDSSLQIGVGVYRNSITGQIYGRLAAELTAELAEANKDRSFRILEVGAGVGGTSDYIIELIKKLDNVSYMFTDLSDIFLDEAHERYSDCDFVDYRIYDINKHPKTQSMPMHSFDLIIGANVFHDAHNIDSVINNMHLLLAEDGKLMIIETTVNTAAQMITAGFAEGLTA